MQKTKKQLSTFSASWRIQLSTCLLAEREDGFGLLEAMVSIFIMIVGVSGAMTLVSGGILNIGVAEDRLVAINLAQEGLEIVHNIRDSNWLSKTDSCDIDGDTIYDDPYPWNDWNRDCSPDSCSVDSPCTGYVLWDSTVFPAPGVTSDIKWNGAHYDNAGAGDVFERSIKITDNPDGDGTTPDIKVESTVGWGGSGDCAGAYKHCVVLEERLYNWLQ